MNTDKLKSAKFIKLLKDANLIETLAAPSGVQKDR